MSACDWSHVRAKLLITAVFALDGTLVSAAAQAPDQTATATVVVFTPGGHWRGFGEQLKKPLFAKTNMMSMGFFFDGDRKIAWLSHSRYLVLRTPAGAHKFSTVMSGREPDAKTALTVTPEAGGVSYVALTATARSYGVVGTQSSGLSLSHCNEFAEANAGHPLESTQEKDIEKPFRGAVLTALPVTPCTR